MTTFLVKGPTRLKGHFKPSGNKNAALPIIAACLLTEEPVTLHNIPRIGDVGTLLGILEDMGASVASPKPDSLRIHCNGMMGPNVSEGARLIRASILLAGPSLARFGEVSLPPPGGDVIGRRRIDSHVRGLEGLGASYSFDDNHMFRAGTLKGSVVFMDEPSVTGTENLIMASVLAKGHTTIENAACEPHVQDLCNFLNTLGAQITGIGSNILQIEGVEQLSGGEYTICSDHIETGSIMALAAVTRSPITIGGYTPDLNKPIDLAWSRLGIHYDALPDQIAQMRFNGAMTIQPDLGGAVPKIEDGPWPSFPADLTSIALVAATQAFGSVLIHEKMFESRMFFVDRLIDMGARIVLCDPHRAVVMGPNRLKSSTMSSPDIRAGMALLIAALVAEGESLINNAEQIERGYEDIDNRLRQMGAEIERID
ncbi:MAG: UDP-N-acetylglucosamine 1-carboxyvinyltransferase [bacterium]|nr:UDP-N-acetylglucosamine 1-carboxyvinyltransferase [bacterium]